MKALADATHVLQSKTGGAEGQFRLRNVDTPRSIRSGDSGKASRQRRTLCLAPSSRFAHFGNFAEIALAKMATRRECVHVRRVPHMRCVMRATAVRACACVVTLYTLRSVRYLQRRNRDAELLHAGKLCLRPETVKQEAHHRPLSLTS